MVKLVRDVTLAASAAAVLTMALSALVPPATAQTMPSQALRQACGGDVRKLCAGVKPGEGRIVQCLAAQPDKVSATCKSAMQEAQATKSGAK